jgi:hypothetical protein
MNNINPVLNLTPEQQKKYDLVAEALGQEQADKLMEAWWKKAERHRIERAELKAKYEGTTDQDPEKFTRVNSEPDSETGKDSEGKSVPKKGPLPGRVPPAYSDPGDYFGLARNVRVRYGSSYEDQETPTIKRIIDGLSSDKIKRPSHYSAIDLDD